MSIETKMKNMILKAIAGNPSSYTLIKALMTSNQKISAIKEIRELGRLVGTNSTGSLFGLRESKEFIDGYYDAWNNPSLTRFHDDVYAARKRGTKKGTKKAIADQYVFDGIDLRQVNTDSLKDLYKTLKRELKKRGEKI